MSAAHGSYYLPNPSPWPLSMTIGLFTLALGGALTMNDLGAGPWLMLAGAALIIYIMFRWFGQVIGESEGGAYNAQVDGSFRMGMTWFIFSEVMFFAAFFGALFYVRQLAVPIIGADELLWPGYDAAWPTSGPKGPAFTAMGPLGIPAWNTLILLTSGLTVTWAITRSTLPSVSARRSWSRGTGAKKTCTFMLPVSTWSQSPGAPSRCRQFSSASR